MVGLLFLVVVPAAVPLRVVTPTDPAERWAASRLRIEEAAVAMARIVPRDQRAVDTLTAMIDDFRQDQQLEAARALGRIAPHSPAAAARLRRAAAGPDAMLRHAAGEALSRAGVDAEAPSSLGLPLAVGVAIAAALACVLVWRLRRSRRRR